MACTHEDCLSEWISPRIGAKPQKRDPSKHGMDCPLCGAGFSIGPGTSHRYVWHCHRKPQPCDPTDLREWLLHHVTVQHLGDYKRFRDQPARRLTKDEQLAEAQKKLRAIERTLTENSNTPALLRIKQAAVLWNSGAVPDDRAGFLALAERAGVGRSQRYEAWSLVCGGRPRQQ